jgi:hypothetical protein
MGTKKGDGTNISASVWPLTAATIPSVPFSAASREDVPHHAAGDIRQAEVAAAVAVG